VFGIAESAFSLIPLPVHEEKCSSTIPFIEQAISLSISKQAPTPDYKRNRDFSPTELARAGFA
jgi:hypothetical protein